MCTFTVAHQNALWTARLQLEAQEERKELELQRATVFSHVGARLSDSSATFDVSKKYFVGPDFS